MDQVEKTVKEVFSRHGIIRVLVACSGGADSFALLQAAVRVLPQPDQVRVVTINHGLRPEANAECDVVCAWAKAHGVAFEKVILPTPPRSQAAARDARYRALRDCATLWHINSIVVGHTATDQVETFFQRLFTGASTRGLGAMLMKRQISSSLQLVRPLLRLSRHETESYAKRNQLPFVTDPSNRDRHYFRARLRQDLLPILAREMPDFETRIGQLCERLQADEEYLEGAARHGSESATTARGLDMTQVSQMAPAISSRILRLQSPVALSAGHVAAIVQLASRAQGTRDLTLPQGWLARVCYGRLQFCRQDAERDPGDIEILLAGPGCYEFLRHRVTILEQKWRASAGPDRQLLLRNFRPGDRFFQGKIQDLFVNRKIPRPERRSWPLLVSRDRQSATERVIWVPRPDELS